MAHEYVTSTVLKATLALTGETFADADVAAALEAASRGVDLVCDRRFWLDADATQVRYYPAYTGWYVAIDDCSTVTSVKTDSSGDGSFSTTLTHVTDYYRMPVNAAADSWPYTYLKINPQSAQYFPIGERTVQVTGQFGWTTTPPAVTQATTILASALLKRSREAPFGIVTFGLDAAGAERIARNDPHVMFLLGPFIRMAV